MSVKTKISNHRARQGWRSFPLGPEAHDLFLYLLPHQMGLPHPVLGASSCHQVRDRVQGDQLKLKAGGTFPRISQARLRFLEMRELAMFVQSKIEGFPLCLFKMSGWVGAT